ncbi:MAG: TonB-dependent receptor [Bryobacterales bacterium]|nr:TonB-dependent receptor [Bryobacterales bacterium]MDE0622699.1 TonB-dependent receptor [Bryobacterales bacterium]
MQLLRMISAVCAAISLAGLGVTALWGQASTGTVVVNVVDPAGLAIPGARVTLTDEATEIQTSRESIEQGSARFTSVKPSTYTVNVSAQGFRQHVQAGVIVHVAESVSLTTQLQIGEVTETIEVTGAVPLLQTEGGEMGQVVEERKIRELPLNGRNPFALAALTPGVAPGQNFGSNPLLLSNLGINGGRGGATEILVDGSPVTVPENSPGTYATAIMPSVDRIQEFKVQTNSFSSEFGRTAGGIINVVVKSGSNEFHGLAFQYLRNSELDANNFFLNRAGRELGVFQRNQFGFTLGGPIVRNRTFFFGGYEGLRQRSQATSATTIPTTAQLGGDFSSTLNRGGNPITIYDPLTTRDDPSGNGKIRDPFQGNVIPGNRIDPVARKVLGLYPQPNTAGRGAANVNNFIAAGSAATDDDNFDVRVDHQLSDSQSIFGRVSYRDFRQARPNFYGTPGQPGPAAIPRPGRNAVIHHSQSLTPSLFSEFGVSFSDLWTVRRSHSFGRNIAEDLGMPQDFANVAEDRGYTRFFVAGFGRIGESFLARFRLQSYGLQYKMTWIRGNHTYKFGTEFRINRTHFFQGLDPAGQFRFTPRFTQGPDPNRGTSVAGHSIASLLLGVADRGFVSHDEAISTQSPYAAWFVQDDIKLTSRFTLNLGLRYSMDWPRSERYDRLSVFNPEATSPLAVPGFSGLRGGLEFVGIDRDAQFELDKNNLSPRFGFAWRALGETVIRGGYAIFYPPPAVTAAGTLGGGGVAGFSSQTPFVASLDGGLTPNDFISNPYPNGFTLPPGSSQGLLSFAGLNFQSNRISDRSPYVQQWNLNIQHELVPNLLLEVGYTGAKGTNLSVVFGSPNMLAAEQLALGPALLQRVDNPFFGVITSPASPLSRPTVTRNRLLRPFPQFGNISLEKGSFASSIYHAAQVRLDRRFSNGLTFLGSYTAGKLIDDSSTSGTGLLPPFAFIQQWHNRAAERSLSVTDVSQRFVLSFLYELPWGQGRSFGTNMGRLANFIAGGWQVNGIWTLATGTPLIVVNAQDNSGALNFAGLAEPGTQRPNNNGSSPRRSGAVVNRLGEYLDTSTFSQPEPFTFGNTARTLPDTRAPGVGQFDSSIFKDFPITEQTNLQFRMEFFNLTNTPNFGPPNTRFGTGAFGVIGRQRNTPRQLQFALRLSF